jgi:hypothetical protein
MSNQVTQVFSGDTTQIEKSYDRMLRKLEQLTAANEKLTSQTMQQSQRAGKSLKEQEDFATSLASSWVTGLAGVAAGYFTIQGAISATNKLLEDQKRLQNEALGSASKVAGIDAALITNLAAGEDMASARGRIQGMMSKYGVSNAAHMAESVRFALAKSGGKASGLDSLESAIALTAKTPQETAATTDAHAALRRIGLTQDQADDVVASASASQPFAMQGDLATRAISTSLAARGYYAKNVDSVEVARQHIALTSLFHQQGATPEVAGTGALGIEGAMNELFTSDPRLKGIDPGDFEGRLNILLGDAEGRAKLAPKVQARLMKELGDNAPGRQVIKGINRQLTAGELTGQFRTLKKEIRADGDAFESRTRMLLAGTDALEMDTAAKADEAEKMFNESTYTPEQRLAIVRRKYDQLIDIAKSRAPSLGIPTRMLTSSIDHVSAWSGDQLWSGTNLWQGANELVQMMKQSGQVDRQMLDKMTRLLEAMEEQNYLIGQDRHAAAAADRARGR